MHNVILSGVQQSESVIHICMYTLFLDSFAIGHCRVLSRVPCVTDQSRSCVQLSVTPWTIARQTLLSFSISQSLLKFMSVESMMLSNHLILCCPLLLLLLVFSSIRVFSNELALCIRWPECWSFSSFWWHLSNESYFSEPAAVHILLQVYPLDLSGPWVWTN